jgi:hypothetical protein
MDTSEQTPSHGDRPPWDPANGLRVGLLAGALVGAAVVALTGVTGFWLVVLTAVVGGTVGYWSEKRKQPR